MASLVLLAGVTASFIAFRIVSGLRHNISEAKRSGLPYVVAPCSPWNLLWQLTCKLWMPLIKMLPQSWWEPWLTPLTHDFSFHTGHQHYAKYGDTFLLVSPGGLMLMTAQAEVIRQVTLRREHFPKYVETYKILSQFGDNVLTVEGAMWRMHRKITSASFNETNAALVFRESTNQAQGMLRLWKDVAASGDSKGGSSTLHTIDRDTMRLALHIIGYVGFGLRLPWQNERPKEDMDPKEAKFRSIEPAPGFEFSFVDTVALLMENIMMLLLVPTWLLKLIPSARTKKAAACRQDYENYMDDLLEEKIEEAREGGQAEEGMDLLGQLVKSSYEVLTDKSGAATASKTGKTPVLARKEITGNAFVMFVAGHETTANAIHFTLLMLATNPGSQRRLQKELTELLGDKDPETWDFDSVVKPLMAGMIGACMNETLRLFPPVLEIPKIATPNQDQPLTMDGRKYVVPKGTNISLSTGAAHRNPRYWPSQPSRLRPCRDDIEDYVPERWFRSRTVASGSSAGVSDRESSSSSASEADDSYESKGSNSRDLNSGGKLFRPARGAYLPFSEGARACLGRRIAQVEVVAALAVIFSQHSVELAVDEWATDEEVEAMSSEQRANVYGKAQQRCREAVSKSVSVITLKVRDQDVPVRLVERGKERFMGAVADKEA